jgi:hypothetical protein
MVPFACEYHKHLIECSENELNYCINKPTPKWYPLLANGGNLCMRIFRRSSGAGCFHGWFKWKWGIGGVTNNAIPNGILVSLKFIVAIIMSSLKGLGFIFISSFYNNVIPKGIRFYDY